MIGLRQCIQKVTCGQTLRLLEGPCALNLTHIRTTKHWHPKFKKLRAQKFLKVKLIDFQKLQKPIEELSREEIRSKLKERGVLPDRPWQERPIYISSTGTIFEPYVPPEGDGKISPITTQGAKQKIEYLEKKSKSMMALRKLRKFDDDFEIDFFLNEAQIIYVKSHQAMCNKDPDELRLYVTERAYPEVVSNIGDKTLHWKFVESIEPAKLVHIRCTDVIEKENMFCQITVRFHTRQILAIYDRFGRLMHGHEELPKDVLEYIVFEKHISNKYGRWRVHDKIIPNWMPLKEPVKKTIMVQQDKEESVQPDNQLVTTA
ncbi:probable 39S ribosomal protein L45, mitochondrial [Cimex lectularius]|uniref:Large ribosomal subunit protein mL45 n=1 Tax=Cimex lectularius TaxID=79782 RepID=A0A8I6RRL7_CIMLE|nr:probable 39S ribosomal protein L45, mitochondrial [Cimex lectularius]